ncbi:MAG: hypothetical protein AAFX54_16905 [Pseudomonadota bacterium]
MGVVEKAGGSLHDFATAKKKKRKQRDKEPVKETARAEPHSFDLDFNALAREGLFHPDVSSTQLALELRAVKRRLLRRIGFLRATGERQAFRAPGRQRNLILVTSTRAGEGKTYNAVNLALSFALEDQIETLLVDADPPRPKVRRRLGLPAGPGLTDKLRDPTLNTEGLCYLAKQAPMSVLGEGAPVGRATELFASDASQRFWTELSAAARDRLVIIDAPPVLATTEAVILAKYVDEIVFVVEANSTPEPAVASALDELLDINPNVSLLLNRCIVGSGGSHYGSYEYYDRSNDGEERTRGSDNA